MSNLGEQLRQIAERNKVKLETVVRETVLEMGSQMVLMSPMDTGRFRSNWMYGAGGINTATTTEADPGGGASVQRITAGVLGWKPGEVMTITNSLPYARRLENGWSGQAPAGMVRVTIANFEAALSRALGEVK